MWKGTTTTGIVWAALLLASCGHADTGTTAPGGATGTVPVQSTVASAARSSATQPTPPMTAASVPVPELSVTPGVAYSDSGLLDIIAPEASGPWPVVVVVHGISQSRAGFAALSEAVAARGAVVYNIQVGMSPPFYDALGQIGCAVRFAWETAADFGGDPSRIVLVGNSSGAHIAAIVALAGRDYPANCSVTGGSGVVRAIIGYEGPFDVATTAYGSVDLRPLEDDDPEMWTAVNTYSHIGGNPDLIVRLIHGRDEDRHWYDVSPDVSADFYDALFAAGYDVELTYVDGAGHGALTDPSSPVFDHTISQVLETTEQLVDAGIDVQSAAPMILTFENGKCVYEGPSVVRAGPANLTFVNNSGATGAVNVIELLDGQTWEDLVEYAGDEPSSKHAPPWSRSVRQWRPIASGETLLWDEKLTAGPYAVVCAKISPLAVWLGSSFEVED